MLAAWPACHFYTLPRLPAAAGQRGCVARLTRCEEEIDGERSGAPLALSIGRLLYSPNVAEHWKPKSQG